MGNTSALPNVLACDRGNTVAFLTFFLHFNGNTSAFPTVPLFLPRRCSFSVLYSKSHALFYWKDLFAVSIAACSSATIRSLRCPAASAFPAALSLPSAFCGGNPFFCAAAVAAVSFSAADLLPAGTVKGVMGVLSTSPPSGVNDSYSYVYSDELASPSSAAAVVLPRCCDCCLSFLSEDTGSCFTTGLGGGGFCGTLGIDSCRCVVVGLPTFTFPCAPVPAAAAVAPAVAVCRLHAPLTARRSRAGMRALPLIPFRRTAIATRRLHGLWRWIWSTPSSVRLRTLIHTLHPFLFVHGPFHFLFAGLPIPISIACVVQPSSTTVQAVPMLFLGTRIVGNRPVTLVTGPGAWISFFAPILHGACGSHFALRHATLCVAFARRRGSLARRLRFLALRRQFFALRRSFLALRRGNFRLGLLFLLGCLFSTRAPLIGAAPRPTRRRHAPARCQQWNM